MTMYWEGGVTTCKGGGYYRKKHSIQNYTKMEKIHEEPNGTLAENNMFLYYFPNEKKNLQIPGISNLD